MIIREVQTSKLAADGKGVSISLTPKDRKKLAALTTSYLGRYLALRATDKIAEIMHITGVIRDGRLEFKYPEEENIAAYLRDRLNLSATTSLQQTPAGNLAESAADAANAAAGITKGAQAEGKGKEKMSSSATAHSEPESVLKSQLEAILGKSNRNVPRVSDVRITGTNIAVRFSVDDNLTENLIRGSAMSDLRNIIKTVHDSAYPYSEVAVAGTFSLRDKFGNSQEEDALRATYKRSTVGRINWTGFATDNIYAIADDVWLHPSFEKKIPLKDLQVPMP